MTTQPNTDLPGDPMLQLYTVEEVAGFLRKNPNKIRYLARAGKIGCVRDGRTITFHRQDIMRYIRANHRPAR
jgi:excisionase family DNA binding protein